MEKCKVCEKKSVVSVPYVAFESAMARSERTSKRLLAIIMLLAMLLAVSNALWFWHSRHFERLGSENDIVEII